MTITISVNAYWELLLEIKDTIRLYDPSDSLDILWQYPPRLGKGQSRFIELREGLGLCISKYQLSDTVITKVKEREHYLEYGFVLLGVGETRHMCKESSMTFSAEK
ncbi:hypothetical protein [Nostoc sp.]|uniref:hypothetical protein n=1 Tax=Nostoc sp. TaxID=1180 RepID=UPI002FF8B878